MNNCKRNILLIFGYLLIVAFLFIPCIKEGCFIQGLSKKIPPIPLGYVLSGEKGQYKIIKKSLNKNKLKLLPLIITDIINHKKFIKWKKQTQEEAVKFQGDKKAATNKEFFYLETEFLNKYNGEFHYDKLRFDFFLTEIVTISLVGGFVYILFCVILRKPEKGGQK